jgi:hypothetical protein
LGILEWLAASRDLVLSAYVPGEDLADSPFSPQLSEDALPEPKRG